MLKPKDYLTYENERNKSHAQLFTDMMKQALGPKWDVLIGHHILYEHDGDVETEGEVPSADTLIFCHDIMTAVFGDDAIEIMHLLVELPAPEREPRLAVIFENYRVAA